MSSSSWYSSSCCCIRARISVISRSLSSSRRLIRSRSRVRASSSSRVLASLADSWFREKTQRPPSYIFTTALSWIREIHLMVNNPLTRCKWKYLFLQLAQLAWQALHSDPGLLQLFVGSSHQVAVPVSWLTGIFQLSGREKRQSAPSRAQLQQKNYTASVWPS